MYPFIETIRIEDQKAENIDFHNERMNRTRNIFFGTCPYIDLRKHIHPEKTSEGIFKCRVVYGKDITDISYTNYRLRPINCLRLIAADDINYQYKYADRSTLEYLYNLRKDADDILIVRNGLLTDTSIANIALFDGKRWYTPTSPLLKGTRRASLLKNGTINELDINAKDIFSFSEISLFNAMIPFGKIRFTIDPYHIV